MFSSIFQVVVLFLLGLLEVGFALPTNNSSLVSRVDYEPGDELGRTLCTCTNDNNFEQADNDPYSISAAPPDHKVAFVYKFDYYNHRLDNHYTIHAIDICTTRLGAKNTNACLKIQEQKKDWCHKFFTQSLPDKVRIHEWEFCYQFRGDDFVGDKHRDFWTFYLDKRGLPRQRDWIADEATVKGRCTDVCRTVWDMEMLESKRGGWFSRADMFHHFDDICYHGTQANPMNCASVG